MREGERQRGRDFAEGRRKSAEEQEGSFLLLNGFVMYWQALSDCLQWLIPSGTRGCLGRKFLPLGGFLYLLFSSMCFYACQFYREMISSELTVIGTI